MTEIDHKTFSQALQIFTAAMIYRWLDRMLYYTTSLSIMPSLFSDLKPSIHTGHPVLVITLMLLELLCICTLTRKKISNVTWPGLYLLELFLGIDSSLVGKGTKLLFPLLIFFWLMMKSLKNSLIQGIALFMALMYFFSGLHKLETTFSVHEFFSGPMGMTPYFLNQLLSPVDGIISAAILVFELSGVLFFLALFFIKGKPFAQAYRFLAIGFHLILFLFSELKFFSLICMIPWILIKPSNQSQKVEVFSDIKLNVIFILVLVTNLSLATGRLLSYAGLNFHWNLAPQTVFDYSAEIKRNEEVLYSSKKSTSVFWFNYLTDSYRYTRKIPLLKKSFCLKTQDTIWLTYRLGEKVDRTWKLPCSI